MRARSVRLGHPARRTEHKPGLRLAVGSPPARWRTLLSIGSRTLFGLLLASLLAVALTSGGATANRLEAPQPGGHFEPISAARKFSARAREQASHPEPLIAQVLFNQKPVPFERGISVGPGAGDLEIRFAPPASGAEDRLRCRLLGFDAEWREADRAHVLRYRLAPGHYEFDVQADGRRLRDSAVESLPIIVHPPFWQTAAFRSQCVVFLLLLILLLHRLRVRFLKKNNRKLQETVTQTRAELTLTARTARDAQEALKEQALKDGLTGLWNRRAVFSMLEKEIYRARRDRFPVTVVMIDLDHFKNINDTFGHPTGDEVLREAAGRLIAVMRPYDFIGRYGGEEFLVVLPSCSSHHGVQRAEEFRCAIALRPVITAAGPLAVTCSVGVAAYDDAMPPDDLIHRADEALYRAKRMGRNCVCAGKPGKTVARVDAPRDDPSRGDRMRAG